MSYEMKTFGQITRFEASVFYRNWKEGNVEAHKEFANTLYSEVDLEYAHASQRYSQDFAFYDNVERLTKSLLDKNFDKAQELVNEIQSDLINRAGQNSIWYKYKKEEH